MPLDDYDTSFALGILFIEWTGSGPLDNKISLVNEDFEVRAVRRPNGGWNFQAIILPDTNWIEAHDPLDPLPNDPAFMVETAVVLSYILHIMDALIRKKDAT